MHREMQKREQEKIRRYFMKLSVLWIFVFMSQRKVYFLL